MKIKDSGTRREFETGAVRDVAEGKGREDLLPLKIIGNMTEDYILRAIGNYVYTGHAPFLHEAIFRFVKNKYLTKWDAWLDVAKHYEAGSAKYPGNNGRNWELGIPLHCFIDSGVRHYFKFMRGDDDEPHDRAFLWNMLGALWTQENKPEMIDLPFAEVEE